MVSDGYPEVLLAKSRRGEREPLTLLQHSLDTEQAARQVFRLDGRWGRNWCRFFRIEARDQERFLTHLRVAALFHDLGKANADFIDAVNGSSRGQLLRHEHISALVLHLPEVRRWLARNSTLDLSVITAAVLSHHVKASNDGPWKWGQPRDARSALRLFLQHEQVASILRRVAEVAEITEPLPKLPEGSWCEGPPWTNAWASGMADARELSRSVRRDRRRLGLLLATKAGVIVADSVASGVVRVGKSIEGWIEEVVHREPIRDTDVARSVIEPRITALSARSGKPFTFHEFQTRAAEQGPRALLLAACGAGKTLAAWKWAERQAREREIGRVVFLYPTRGTATEGFRDYVGWAPEGEGALVHGTASYELEGMRENPSEATRGKEFGLNETDARLFALGLWPRRYFSATVDQFLSFMENGYAGICLLPVLADSAVIIDEVHSFDRRMFDALIQFLRNFDVPVLCMTATLPASRRKQLVEVGLSVYPSESDRTTLEDLVRREEHPRYHLTRLGEENEAFEKAVLAYRSGQRVLWVVNRVARAQALAHKLREELGPEVLCYHSRYRLCDRQRIHAETVEAFKQKTEPAIAVTTQVCEMSLDLDADVLLTELAPPPSLVQRFGRANRHAEPGSEARAQLYVYEPERSEPYTREDLEAAKAFLGDLGERDISQRVLALALERHALAEREPPESGRFLESGYFATPGSFRDTDEFSVPCVLDRDVAEVEARVRAGRPFDGFVVNVPRRAARKPEEGRRGWPSHLSIASAEDYSESLGFVANAGSES